MALVKRLKNVWQILFSSMVFNEYTFCWSISHRAQFIIIIIIILANYSIDFTPLFCKVTCSQKKPFIIIFLTWPWPQGEWTMIKILHSKFDSKNYISRLPISSISNPWTLHILEIIFYSHIVFFLLEIQNKHWVNLMSYMMTLNLIPFWLW